MLLYSLVCMSIAFMMDEGVSTWSFGFRDRCALYISHSRCSYLICVAVNFDSLGGYCGTVAAKQCLILLLSRRFPLYGIVKLFLDGIEIISFFYNSCYYCVLLVSAILNYYFINPIAPLFLSVMLKSQDRTAKMYCIICHVLRS